ncbi:hypothetical protein FH972_026535 [Carpinus fangiana]|uniref:Uncharacterized protein n=1 Tax=Carpinus fangiana TaxID=176857 RepID=A0A5N6L4D2_9ROSI|nr:hypothetical protein FH972_026535 [Carpinus fangiana]
MDNNQSHSDVDATGASNPDGPGLWPDEIEEELESIRNIRVVKYGDDPFVRASNDLDRVQELLSDGVSVTAEGIFAAIEDRNNTVDILDTLLKSGVDPNIRSHTATDEGVIPGWSNRDVTLYFRQDWHDWYPLQMAACTLTIPREQICRQIALLNRLLDCRPNLYAVYRQPLQRSYATPFPGDEYDDELDPGEDIDPYDIEEDDQPPKAPIYGLRSVLHSIIEDGWFIEPFFMSCHLDLESRDPLGRTILHSACRSALGADTVLDGKINDVYWHSDTDTYSHNPFVSTRDRPSLFHTLRLRNADLLAVDFSGKNILHHLLEAEDFKTANFRPPMIKDSLKYVLEHLQTLVNQPDRHGTFPLHAALQRCRRYPVKNFYTDAASVEPVVDQLLEAGADPLARDGRGNTALHYLASYGLTQQCHGETTRRLFKYFLACGVDVNVRNKSGRTALEILLEDDGKIASLRSSSSISYPVQGEMPTKEELNAYVLDCFNEAGVKWTATDPHGQTLLHIVAKQSKGFEVQGFRVKSFLSKGVDPTIKDKDGRTALDLATKAEVIDILRAVEL